VIVRHVGFEVGNAKDDFVQFTQGVLKLQQQLRLSEETIVILLQLVAQCDENWLADISITQLARITDKHPKTVEKAVTVLKRKGLIERPRTKGNRRGFQLLSLWATILEQEFRDDGMWEE
jgi:DNA-binding MarR family transcriptional regulator